jgi:hypothetical protein
VLTGNESAGGWEAVEGDSFRSEESALSSQIRARDRRDRSARTPVRVRLVPFFEGPPQSARGRCQAARVWVSRAPSPRSPKVLPPGARRPWAGGGAQKKRDLGALRPANWHFLGHRRRLQSSSGAEPTVPSRRRRAPGALDSRPTATDHSATPRGVRRRSVCPSTSGGFGFGRPLSSAPWPDRGPGELEPPGQVGDG